MIPIDAILDHYRHGYFPMGQHRDDPEMDWHNPSQRAILPIAELIITDPLRDMLLDGAYDIRINTAFNAVIEGCAEETRQHQGTWINQPILDIFKALHRAGYAHSVECWRGNELAGGIYGLIPGGAVFCAESMFSRAPRASSVALAHLCARLWRGGFSILDCQILNTHTAKFGAYAIPRANYLHLVQQALQTPANWRKADELSESALIRDYLQRRKSPHCG